MSILFLFAVFESSLFPHSILLENQFNPATLYQKQFEIIAGTEVKFGLPELRTYTIYSQIKSYSIAVTSFGSDLYKENVIGFGFGFPVVKKLAVGLNISLLNYWIKEHYSHLGYSIRVGGFFQNSPFEIGAWVNNINIPRFSEIDYVPLSYSVRCSYFAVHNLSFNFAIRGVETDLPFFNFGAFYSPYKIIELAAGINTEPLLLEYGLKINLGEFTMGYAGSHHRQLGLSHQLSIAFGV